MILDAALKLVGNSTACFVFKNARTGFQDVSDLLSLLSLRSLRLSKCDVFIISPIQSSNFGAEPFYFHCCRINFLAITIPSRNAICLRFLADAKELVFPSNNENLLRQFLLFHFEVELMILYLFLQVFSHAL